MKTHCPLCGKWLQLFLEGEWCNGIDGDGLWCEYMRYYR